jgi:hypothetical protein
MGAGNCQNVKRGFVVLSCDIRAFVILKIKKTPLRPSQPTGVETLMSEKQPECPLYNPLNCKEYHNPKLCAFVREDGVCRKKKKTASAKTAAKTKAELSAS